MIFSKNDSLKSKRYLLPIIFSALGLIGCADNDGNSEGTASETSTQTSTNDETSTITLSQTDTLTDTNSQSQTGTESETNTNSQSNTDSETDTDTNSQSQTDTKSETETDTNSQSNTDSETQTQTQTDIETDPVKIKETSVLTVYEYYELLSEAMYEVKGNPVTALRDPDHDTTLSTINYECVNFDGQPGIAEEKEFTDGSSILTITQCATSYGLLNLSITSTPNEVTELFMSLETQSGTSSMLLEIGVDSRTVLVTTELNEIYSFEVGQEFENYTSNGAELNIEFSPFEFTTDSQCEYSRSESVIVNQGLPYLVAPDIENHCVDTINFSTSKTWSQAESTLIYKIDVSDSTSFNAAFIAQDLDTAFKTTLLDDRGNKLNYWYPDNVFYYLLDTQLEAGQYFIHLEHLSSNDSIGELYFEIDSEFAMVSFVEETAAPITLSEVLISYGDVYELNVTQADIFRFKINSDYYENFVGLSVTDDQGIQQKEIQLSFNGEYQEIDLEIGQYFVFVTGVEVEQILQLQTKQSNPASLVITDTAPKIVTNRTPSSALLDTQYSQSDYTLNITLDNYAQMVQLANEHIPEETDFTNIVNGNITLSANSDALLGYTTYDCEVSGNYYEPNGFDAAGYTEDCVMNSGPVEYNFNTNFSPYTHYYSFTTQDGFVLTVDKVWGNSFFFDAELEQETFISLEGFGSFMVKGDADREVKNFFGASNSYLFTDYDYLNTEISQDSLCLFNEVSKYEVNGFFVDTIVGFEDNCVEDFDFEITRSWSEPLSTLEYQLTVPNDNTELLVFKSTGQIYNEYLITTIYDQNLSPAYLDVAGGGYTNIEEVLDAGVYTIYLQNTFDSDGEVEHDVYMQLKAMGATLEFIQEIAPPTIEQTVLVDQLVTEQDGITFDLVVSEASMISIEFVTVEDVEFYLFNSNNEMLRDAYALGDDMFIQLPVGSYQLRASTWDSTYLDVILKTDTQDSVSITLAP